MKILHAIGSLNPAHGGTTFGLRGLVQSLLEKGHSTEVLVTDPPVSPWLAEWPCRVHPMGKGWGPYGHNRAFASKAKEIVADFDHVIVHGLWRQLGPDIRHACMPLGVPYYVFPHGMLDRWISEAYPAKHLMKQLYWRFTQARVMRDASAVFFTTQAELDNGRDTFSPFEVSPAFTPFGIHPPPNSPSLYRQQFSAKCPELATKRVVLFLGRLHPKKGCDLLVEGFARWIQGMSLDEASLWHLRLAGPPEDQSYLHKLHGIAQEFGLIPNEQISFPGSVQGEQKWQELSHAEVLALPSHQENFGVVIAEAMACNTPVLISDKVNGWPIIKNNGAGLVAPDSVDGVISLLNQWRAMNEGAHGAMRKAARSHFEKSMSADVSAQALVDVLTVFTSATMP